jgi:hypothetical protein
MPEDGQLQSEAGETFGLFLPALPDHISFIDFHAFSLAFMQTYGVALASSLDSAIPKGDKQQWRSSIKKKRMLNWVDSGGTRT